MKPALPNPRLQRTRSAPLRSPLSRKPFGDAKRHCRMVKRAVVGLVAVASLAIGCMGWGDMDPFRTSFRDVCGDVQLNRFEDELLYLTDKKANDSRILAGNVERIGLGRGKVLASVAARNGPAGWMFVDCRTKSVEGPLSEEQLRTREEIKDINLVAVEIAWKQFEK